MSKIAALRKMLAGAIRRGEGRASEVNRDLFDGTAHNPPRHMVEPTKVFHGTRAKIEGDFDPFTHFGTKRAAKDRLKDTRPGAVELPGRAKLMKRKIAPGRQVEIRDNPGSASLADVIDQLHARGAIDDGERSYVSAALNNGEVKAAAERALMILNKRGIVAIRYRNGVEDKGSISYIVPDPKNLTLGLAGLIAAAGGSMATRTNNAEPVSTLNRRRA